MNYEELKDLNNEELLRVVDRTNNAETKVLAERLHELIEEINKELIAEVLQRHS